MIDRIREQDRPILFQLDAGNLLKAQGSPAERRATNAAIIELLDEIGMDIVGPTDNDLAELSPLGDQFDQPAFHWPREPRWVRLHREDVALDVLVLGEVSPLNLGGLEGTAEGPEGVGSTPALARIGLATIRDVEPEDLLDELPPLDVLVISRNDVYRKRSRILGQTLVAFAPAEGQYLGQLRITPGETPERLTVEESWLSLFAPKLADRRVASRIDALNADLHAIQRAEATDEVLPELVARWATAEDCGACHGTEYTAWKRSHHAAAIESLRQRKKELEGECVRCHVTGWDEGFVNVLATPQLAEVQCEACHGAGRAHADDPGVPMGRVAAGRCLACHTRENSPEFDRTEYLGRIRHW